MAAKHLVLPTLCLGGATLLLAPARPAPAFSKLGGLLNLGQRDVRLFNNFEDPTANDNTTPASQFPGWLGAELAIWKGIVEWSSGPHGDGTGDPLGSNSLGSGNSNFDALWSGSADAIGSTNNNIVSAQSGCGGGGTLAYTETPISDGWRIRFCEDWEWDDGPGTIDSRWDIQGIMSHEYGHALGLGHSMNAFATMDPSASPGQTGIRSIHADDTSGIQCVYGVSSALKPVIVATVADGTSITIHGSHFDLTSNEVWFTNGTVTPAAADPIVKVIGASSIGGNEITVTIPADAGPGDVMVRVPGNSGASLSNAFPTDLEGTFGNVPDPFPNITFLSPSTVDALVPGTAQTVTLTGLDLLLTTDVLLDGTPMDASRYTIVDDNTITVDMPQASSLGTHQIGLTNGTTTDTFSISVVAPATAKLQFGNGEPLNVVDRDLGLDVVVSGQPGDLHYVRASLNHYPNLDRFLNLAPGHPAAPLYNGGAITIPAKGWASYHLGNLPDPGLLGMDWFAQSFVLDRPRPFATSNQQSIHLVQ